MAISEDGGVLYVFGGDTIGPSRSSRKVGGWLKTTVNTVQPILLRVRPLATLATDALERLVASRQTGKKGDAWGELWQLRPLLSNLPPLTTVELFRRANKFLYEENTP
jgi:hypothetical protein